MPRFVAFLRAINLGGNRVVKMDLLRRLFESLGFSGVATFIASGNVVFDTRAKKAKILERNIEKELRKAVGYDVAVFIRKDAELKRIASFGPFPQSRIYDGAGVNVIFLAEELDAGSRQMILALRTETDDFCIRGREIYWLLLRKPGKSIFSTVPLARALRKPFTIRSANTIRKLAVKYL